MRFSYAAIGVLGSILAAACSAYGPDDEAADSTSAALKGGHDHGHGHGGGPGNNNQTIPRVPNPPVAADASSLAGDLRASAIPTADTSAFIKNKQAAIALGKALFWDMQVGADGITACASCHFRAGADPRSKNQVSPGLKHFPNPDETFQTGRGPNYQLKPSDFPLTRLAIPNTRGALDPKKDSNDVVSSQGVHFLDWGSDPDGFNVGQYKTRRVEPRNTPTMINAVFNHRQFWDGRAENIFNGVNHVGARDPNARVLRSNNPNQDPVPVQIALVNSSLASQAVAPIVNDFEMARPGDTPQDVARRLTRASRKLGKHIHGNRPLGNQKVHPQDSVLGPISRWPAKGLDYKSYDDMIKAAFHDVWWDSDKIVRVEDDGDVTFVSRARAGNRWSDRDSEDYSLMQYNFALFFGLAIQEYEATLVSDDAPWDRFRRQHPSSTDPALNPWTNTNPAHISRLALFGAHLFNDRTRGPTNIRCSNCHELAEFTDASVRRINAAANGPVRNRDGNVIDKGFNNIGVRPTSDDLGVGANDAFGPLSHSKRRFPDGAPINETFDNAVVTKGFGLEGAFKTPSLRNVALTAPYFHNGDARTLHEAVAFYNRGGNVAPITELDGTPIEPLGIPGLQPSEIDAIVAFLESLTDERVLYRRAPFDHPQLFVPNGHVGNDKSVVGTPLTRYALDEYYEVTAVGANGGTPIPGFLEGPFK